MIARTFAAAALLGAVAAGPAHADAWGPETNLSLTATDSETGLGHRSLERTPDGAFHVVWAERDTPDLTYRVWTRRLAGGTWSPAELLVDYLGTDPGDPGDDIGAKYPALVTAADGTLHLFWHDYRVAGILNVEIFTKSRAPGAAWDPDRAADIRLTHTTHTESPGDNGYVPVPAAAPDGAVHVVWYDYRWDATAAEIHAKTRPAGGAWDLSPGDGADARVTNDPAHSELADVATDAAGNLMCVWRSVSGGARVRFAMREAAGGAWSAPQDVDTGGTVGGAPCVAVDAAGRAHVVWPDSRDGGRALWTRVREPSGAWGAEHRITRPAHAADSPSLDAAEDGTLHLVWDDGRVSLFNREVFHRTLAPDAAWDSTGAADFRVSAAAGASVRPAVRAAGGAVLITWRDERDGNRELYARLRTSAATAVAAAGIVAGGPALRVAPNPTAGPLRILRPAGASDRGDVLVLDAAGRLVRSLRGGDVIAWDGRDAAGRPVAAGAYFVRDGNRGGAARVVVLR